MGMALIAGSGGLRVWGRFRSGCLWGGVGAVWDLGRFASLGLGVSGSFGAFLGRIFLTPSVVGNIYFLLWVVMHFELRFSLQWPAFYFPCISYCYYY